MNRAATGTVDRVEVRLVPDVSEILVLGPLFDLTIGVVATVAIQKEHTALGQLTADVSEVGPHHLALLEDPIAEVHGEDDVGRQFGRDLTHIALNQLDTFSRTGFEHVHMIGLTPSEGRSIDVDAIAAMALAAPDPLAGRVARAAEVLPKDARTATGQLLEGGFDKINLRLGTLHRRLVQFVSVCLVRHRRRGFPRLGPPIAAPPAPPRRLCGSLLVG